MGIHVYVASPYSKGDTVQNVRNAVLVGDRLAIHGFYPFIPVLTHFWHYLRPHEYGFWMEQDKAWLLKCDCLLRVPGESRGADEEVKLARKNNIPVFFTVSALLEHYQFKANNGN
jgi:hypothetical protein